MIINMNWHEVIKKLEVVGVFSSKELNWNDNFYKVVPLFPKTIIGMYPVTSFNFEKAAFWAAGNCNIYITSWGENQSLIALQPMDKSIPPDKEAKDAFGRLAAMFGVSGQADVSIEPEQADGSIEPEQVKRKKGGRPHYPEDVWAHEQIVTLKRPSEAVREEWQEKVGDNPKRKNTGGLELVFKRITNPAWGHKSQ